ncbi:Uncharacterised protein [Yersinia pseudotuberculosis]|uniref:Uncharacterized protein n=1 Tax=Yersinia pseudotuberculosis TaxID=633 RepID=A0A380Q6Y5_YERPU|nr:Uncharacterised protein [Yersinia pseudotuberculosis]
MSDPLHSDYLQQCRLLHLNVRLCLVHDFLRGILILVSKYMKFDVTRSLVRVLPHPSHRYADLQGCFQHQ